MSPALFLSVSPSFSGWPWTHDPPGSTSQLLRFDVHHHACVISNSSWKQCTLFSKWTWQSTEILQKWVRQGWRQQQTLRQVPPNCVTSVTVCTFFYPVKKPLCSGYHCILRQPETISVGKPNRQIHRHSWKWDWPKYSAARGGRNAGRMAGTHGYHPSWQDTNPHPHSAFQPQNFM